MNTKTGNKLPCFTLFDCQLSATKELIPRYECID